MIGLLLAALLTWLAHAGEVRPVWEQIPDPVMATRPTAVAHSADGLTFVIASDGTLQGWSPRKLQRRWSVTADARITRAMATLHHGHAFVAGDDSGQVAVFDLETGAKQRVLGTLTGWVSDVAISHDDALIAAVDLTGGLGVWTLDGRTGAKGIGVLGVIDLATGERTIWAASSGPAHRYGQAVDVSADGGRVALGSWGGGVEVRDLGDGGVYWSDRLSQNFIGDVRFLDDDKHVLAIGPETQAVYDAATGATLAKRNGPRMDDISVAPDGESLLGASMLQARVRRLALPSLEDLDDPRQVEGAIDVLGFSPDGSVLAAASSTGRYVIFRDAHTSRERARLHDWRCTGMGGVRWDRQGEHVLVASCDYSVGLSVLHWPSLKPVRGLDSLPTNGEGWFTADGQHLIVMDAFGFDTPRVYRIDGGAQVPAEAVAPRWLQPLNTPHPDVALAIFGHRSVLISHWLNAAQPVPPAVTAGPLNDAMQMGGYSTDGTTTVTLQGDAVVRREGEIVARIPLSRLDARVVALSPDGKRLAVGFADGAVRLYRLQAAMTVHEQP